jgi:hypothetical protein
LGRKQLRWATRKHAAVDAVAKMIFEEFEKQTAGRLDAPHFTLNMARLYWFQASWKLQVLEDGAATSWVLADGLMKSVPMALVQASLRRSTAGLHHARNKLKVTHMWNLCERLFQPDGEHWSLRQSAAPAASGPASSVVSDDEELPDWGGSSENESEDEHAGPAAGQTESTLHEALISPIRPDPIDPPIRWKKNGWVEDLTPNEYAAIHNVPSFAGQWRLAGDDIASMTKLTHVEHLMPQPCLGSFVWNFLSDKPAPHMRRDQGTRPVCGLQGGAVGNKHWTPWIDALGSKVGWVSPLSSFLEVFRTWIQLRPAIAGRVRELRPVTPREWLELGMTTLGDTIGHSRLGYWLRMTFNDVHTRPTEVYGEDSVRGWHGTSMYCIARVIQQRGLSNGFAQNAQNGSVVQGVFYMHAAQARLCESYMHYCMLNDDGWLVSPLLELCVNEKACIGKMVTALRRKGSSGSNTTQRVADASHVSLHSVLFHIMHVSELIGADKSLWLNAEPGFHPLLELDPYEPWEAIVQRSRERQNLTFV